MAEKESEYYYQSPFSSRYCCKSPFLTLFSERTKIITWRKLWCWLAEAQIELGVERVTADMLEEMQMNISNIDWDSAREDEKRMRHDVMAHIHTYQKICPKAAGIIHLGATSCFVQDNADLIIMRDALDMVLEKLATCLCRLSDFASKHKTTPTVGRTHYQTASITTVGKRACIWAQELLMAFKQIVRVREDLRFRGIKGATGTQDSFLTLFNGDGEKVDQLDQRVTKLAGFQNRFIISGQTYDRLQDYLIVSALAMCGAGVYKICMDIRMGQANGELLEPFEKEQVGSSAMPYKKNPMRSERCCGFARYLMNLPSNAIDTAATQGFERTLDDSANRRIVLPEAFLTTDAMLTTFQNISEGLTVRENTVANTVARELPFLALEKVLITLTQEGASRQEAHEKIRQVALAAQEKREQGEIVDLVTILSNDAYFSNVIDKAVMWCQDPTQFTGRCKEQIEEFLQKELHPALEPYKKNVGQKANLDV